MKAFIFPGQGSQYAGMSGALGNLTSEEKDIFAAADDILGFSISRLIAEGPDDELMKTSNAQPALLAVSWAWFCRARSLGHAPDIVLGHSLGEYSALLCCGALSYEDALLLVRKRGELFEEAVANTPGKMAAVMRSDSKTIQDIVDMCSALGVIEITNFNAPEQCVLSGEERAIDAALEMIKEKKAGIARPLNVSAPFHSSLMKGAAEAFSDFLDTVSVNRPAVSFIANVTGERVDDPDIIRSLLVSQIYMPVLWEKSVKTAHAMGASTFIECGPGSVLCGLVKRTVQGAQLVNSEKTFAAV